MAVGVDWWGRLSRRIAGSIAALYPVTVIMKNMYKKTLLGSFCVRVF